MILEQRRFTTLGLFASIIALLLCGHPGAAAAKKHVLLVVLTHGDDNVALAPLMARYSTEGHTVDYAMFTGLQDLSGEENSPARGEVLCASRALGVHETFVMRGPEGVGFDTQSAIAVRLIALIDQTKPDVIVTWGVDGVNGNPRHLLVSNVVTRVFQKQTLLTHQPHKLYYIAMPESRFPTDRGDFGIGNNTGPFLATVTDRFITTRVDGTRYLAQAREAIACHTTAHGQYSTNADWQQAWATHMTKTLRGTVFLRLAIPVNTRRETDIFDGL
jgi:LmbE family N-acetylglucosaminyl deacetylase